MSSAEPITSAVRATLNLTMPFLVGLYVLAGRLRAPQARRAQAAILLVLAMFSAYAIELFAS